VMVHNPALATQGIEMLQRDPPAHPIVLLVGHTHRADIQIHPEVTVINAGTVGAGGTGNLDEEAKIGAARMIYFGDRGPFAPLAADLVEIDPGSGSATARRFRLDVDEISQARK
jgi:hypothetical protein